MDVPEDGSLLSLWKNLAPDLVVTSASGTELEAQTITLSREHGVAVVAILDSWYGYARRLGNQIPDHIVVIDDVAAADAVREGLPADRLRIVGHPAWERVLVLPDTNLKVVLFVGQPIRQQYGNDLGYDQHTAFRLLQQAAELRPDLIEDVLFSPHPADDMKPPSEIESVTGAEGLQRAGIVTGMFSSLLVEAALAGRHVVSLHPGTDAPAICPFGGKADLPHAGSVDAVIATLLNPKRTAAGLRTQLAGSNDRLDQLFRGLVPRAGRA